MHLVGELLDQMSELRPGQAGEIARVRTGTTTRRQPGHRRLAPTLLPATAADELAGVSVLASDRVEDVGDALAQRLRVDAVLLVECNLLVPPSVRLVDRATHRRRDLVGVHVHLPGHVAR